MARSGLTLNGAITGPGLGDARTFDELLATRAEMLGWYVPDPARLTLVSGRVSALADRSSAAKGASQATDAKRPLLNPSVAAMGNRPSMTFDAARGDCLLSPIVVPGTAWTKWAVLTPVAEATSNVFHDILSGQSASAGLHRFAIRGTNTIHSRVGTSGTQASASVAYTPGVPILAMATWDGATRTTRVAINGASWTSGTNAAAVCSDPALVIGGVAPIGGFAGCGDIFDCGMFNVDLSASSNAALLGLLKQYARDRYGLTVA
ncbi:hypothetical protein [Roseomonas chloroacetimidivorans]|uniref:hypothetical protein n=1 Tax=Roseomonas chloroacetimidivorans TaxID=1766656 RepID=UPI003C77DC6A